MTQAFVITASSVVIGAGGAWLYREYATEKVRKQAVEICIDVKVEMGDRADMWLTEQIRTSLPLKRAWFRPGCERDPKNWSIGDGTYQ